jgi:hypothetical protein
MKTAKGIFLSVFIVMTIFSCNSKKNNSKSEYNNNSTSLPSGTNRDSLQNNNDADSLNSDSLRKNR